MPSVQTKEYSIAVLITAIIILIISISGQLPLYAVIDKTTNGENSLKTNMALKQFKNISSMAVVVLVIIQAVFITRFSACQQNIKKQCQESFNLALETAENCNNLNEVYDFLSSKNYNFTELKNNGNFDGYVLENSISKISFTLNNDDEKTEEKHGLERLASIFTDTIKSKHPESYEQKNEYYIHFSLTNLSKYKNGSESISLIKLKTNEDDLDKMFDLETKVKNSFENSIDMLKISCPTAAYITPSKDKSRINSEINLTYSAGFNENAYNTEFNFIIKSDKAKKINELKENIISEIKADMHPKS